MSIKFLVLGGGVLGLGGGGSADFIFMGARIFLSNGPETNSSNLFCVSLFFAGGAGGVVTASYSTISRTSEKYRT